MSERMAAEIWIGGQIPSDLAPELCQEISGAGVMDGTYNGFWPQLPAELMAAREDVREALVLHLADDQARWGRFEELEEFLEEHRIAYRRRSEAKYEYDAELVEYRPELGTVCYPTNSTGEPFVRLDSLVTVDKALTRTVERLRLGRTKDPLAALCRIQRSVRKFMPRIVPQLETFQIVG